MHRVFKKECMRESLLLLFGVCLMVELSAQKVYRKESWGVNETKNSGSPITRVEGQNSVTSITNIGYQSQFQLIDELKEQKKIGKIGGEKYKARLAEYKDNSIGGMAYLYVERPELADANTNNFKMRILTESGELIQEKQMRTQDGKINKDGSAYKNDGTIFIKSEINTNFLIEVMEGESVFKFKVSPILK